MCQQIEVIKQQLAEVMQSSHLQDASFQQPSRQRRCCPRCRNLAWTRTVIRQKWHYSTSRRVCASADNKRATILVGLDISTPSIMTALSATSRLCEHSSISQRTAHNSQNFHKTHARNMPMWSSYVTKFRKFTVFGVLPPAPAR